MQAADSYRQPRDVLGKRRAARLAPDGKELVSARVSGEHAHQLRKATYANGAGRNVSDVVRREYRLKLFQRA